MVELFSIHSKSWSHKYIGSSENFGGVEIIQVLGSKGIAPTRIGFIIALP